MSYPLEQIQRWMQSVLMHPGGVVAGMASPDAQQQIALEAGDIERVIEPSAALDATERLEIYARAYYARLVECLEAEFPILSRAMGAELFQEFAVGYLERYPSRSYTLNRLGEHFADYLAETMAADAEAVAATEPAAAPDANSAADAGPAFLIDLARLEWLFGEVFDGPGAEKSALLDPEQLSRIDPQQWAAARLTPVPCLRLVELNWPVQEYYRALRESADVPPPRPGHTRLAVTRRDYVVRHYPLDRTQFELLAAIMAGQTIGEAVASAVELGEFEPDELAARLRDWFRFWAAEGFFLAVR